VAVGSLFEYYRLRGYLRAKTPVHLVCPSPASTAIAEIVTRDDREIAKANAKWVVALDHLSMNDIFRIRAERGFGMLLRSLEPFGHISLVKRTAHTVTF